MKIPKFELSMILFLALTMNYCYASENSQMPESNKTVPLDSATIKIQNAKALAIGRFGDRIKFDGNGIPYEIGGDLSKGITSTDMVEKVYQFFEINKDIFGIEDPKTELKIDAVNKDEIQAVKFHWTVNGVKVASNFSILFTKDGKPHNYSGKLYPEAKSIDTNPKLSEEQAKQIALDDSRAYHTTVENVKSIELIIGKFDDCLKLAWAINVCKLDSVIFNSDYYIDAQNGKILDIKTRIRD
jgi:Zn-dependent metalloprotease